VYDHSGNLGHDCGENCMDAGADGNNSRNVTINGLSVNVNGYNAQNDDDLAETVVSRINAMLNEDEKEWGR